MDKDEVRHCLEDLVSEIEGRDDTSGTQGTSRKAFWATMLVPVMVISMVGWWGVQGMVNNPGFEFGLHCPVGDMLRELSTLDAVAYFYLKPQIAEICDDEDSLWRLFTDTWTRAILTTDTWYLLYFQMKSCALALGITLLATPFLSFLYTALLGYPLYLIEHSIAIPSWLDTPMHGVCLCVYCLLTVFTVICRSSPVGIGIRGARLSMNALDKDCYDFTGLMERERRVLARGTPASFMFLVRRNTRVFESCIISSVVFVVVLRFILLWSGIHLPDYLPLLAPYKEDLQHLTPPHFSLLLEGVASVFIRDKASLPLLITLFLFACIAVDYLSSQSFLAEGSSSERRRSAIVKHAKEVLQKF